MKTKTTFFCQNCGAQYAKWMGQCKSCNEWNTIVEEIIQKEEKRAWKPTDTTSKSVVSKPQKVSEIRVDKEPRISTFNNELDNVLGGGVVPGSLILLGGEPGIGKSTLLLQVALSMSQNVLYVSGEESQTQLKMRAERLQKKDSDLLLTETNTQNIFRHITELQPDVLVVDSIQTLHTNAIDATPGSISQIRETAAELIRFAKETATPVFLIGHITKDGNIQDQKF